MADGSVLNTRANTENIVYAINSKIAFIHIGTMSLVCGSQDGRHEYQHLQIFMGCGLL